MTDAHKLLIVLLCCTAIAWTAGPTGQFLVIVLLLLFVPGYLLTRLVPAFDTSGVFLAPALWLGLSLGIIPLIYAWTTAAGLHLSTNLLAFIAAGCGIALVWSLWQSSSGMPCPDTFLNRTEHTDQIARHNVSAVAEHRRKPKRASRYARIYWGLLLIVGILTIWNRFVQIEALVLPAWVDSVHHALMIRVTIENGQVPYSLRPYLPVDNLPYHWGYHVITAAITQLSGLDIPHVMLWEGQIINALHILTCAAMAEYFWRHARAGVIAGVVVGLISIMPAYYVSWGRYTHLCGMLMLPILAIAWHRFLHAPSRPWLVYTTILLTGLCLVHMLVLFLALFLLAIITLIWMHTAPRSASLVRARLPYIAGVAGLSLVAALPWLWVIARRILMPAIERPAQELVTGGDFSALHDGLLWAGQNRMLIALALIGIIWGLWHRSRVIVILVGWAGVLVVVANPWMLGYISPATGSILLVWAAAQRRVILAGVGIVLLLLNPYLVSFPYLWVITNDILCMSLFLPLSVVLGGGFHGAMLWLNRVPRGHWQALGRFSLITAVCLYALWGTWKLRYVINQDTVLVQKADMVALEWIADHPETIPPDARFLINAASWYPAADRGTDGGYWLMNITGHWISTPPSLFKHGSADYVSQVQNLSNFVVGFQDGQQEELYRRIEHEGITHVYVRDGTGPLTVSHFDNRFRAVYAYDGITILAVPE